MLVIGRIVQRHKSCYGMWGDTDLYYIVFTLYVMVFNQLHSNASIGLLFFFIRFVLSLLLNSASSKFVHTSLKLFSLLIFLQVTVQRRRKMHILKCVHTGQQPSRRNLPIFTCLSNVLVSIFQLLLLPEIMYLWNCQYANMILLEENFFVCIFTKQDTLLCAFPGLLVKDGRDSCPSLFITLWLNF